MQHTDRPRVLKSLVVDGVKNRAGVEVNRATRVGEITVTLVVNLLGGEERHEEVNKIFITSYKNAVDVRSLENLCRLS